MIRPDIVANRCIRIMMMSEHSGQLWLKFPICFKAEEFVTDCHVEKTTSSSSIFRE